jgi:hypothetical protein
MIQQRDPQQLAGLTQPRRQRTIFLARCHVIGGMIMLCGVASYVEFLHADAAIPA